MNCSSGITRSESNGVRDELATRFLPLALSLSRRYHSPKDREDLDQVASLALLKALERFDPTRGIRVLHLRGSDDRGRAQALLSRLRVDGAVPRCH